MGLRTLTCTSTSIVGPLLNVRKLPGERPLTSSISIGPLVTKLAPTATCWTNSRGVGRELAETYVRQSPSSSLSAGHVGGRGFHAVPQGGTRILRGASRPSTDVLGSEHPVLWDSGLLGVLPKLNCETIMHPKKQSSKQTEARPSLRRPNPQSGVGRPGASPDQVYKSLRCAIRTGSKLESASAVRNQLSKATNERVVQLPEMRGSSRLCWTSRDQGSWLRCGNKVSRV
jgi:hypothetical protein